MGIIYKDFSQKKKKILVSGFPIKCFNIKLYIIYLIHTISIYKSFNNIIKADHNPSKG